MESATEAPSGGDNSNCTYEGTDHLDVKIWLIGVFAVGICAISVILNAFFSFVFWRSPAIRKTPVYYFGILAFIDILLAINYVLVIAMPVYFDFYESLTIYHLYLTYFRSMLTETAIVMFASMLLILLATTERLLRTFHSRNIIRVRKNVMAEQFNVLSVLFQHTKAPFYVRKIRQVRKFLESNRPLVCLFCITVSILYKSCHYFELTYYEAEENCTGFAQYAIDATPLVHENYWYQFWWMFVARNVIDRIAPFFILVIMNVLIIRALKREYAKLATEPKFSVADANGVNRKGRSGNKPSRSSLRDATRALISVVSTYLISQSLQVILTFAEAINKERLMTEHRVLYSYANDVVSILPLIASCLRYPIYCTCNKSIRQASVETLQSCLRFSSAYTAIGGKGGALASPGSTPPPPLTAVAILPLEHKEKLKGTEAVPLAPLTHCASFEALSDDSEQEWQL